MLVIISCPRAVDTAIAAAPYDNLITNILINNCTMEKVKHSNNFSKLAVVLAVTFLAGGIGSLATSASVDTWYTGLILPDLAPPNWLFAPVWIALYVAMSVAGWLVWRKGRKTEYVTSSIIVYLVQLGLNSLWSVLFFGLESPALGLVGIGALWLAILAMIAIFAKVSKPAALILTPYLAWVSFAGYLNYEIWLLN